jgi:hypothetical protein
MDGIDASAIAAVSQSSNAVIDGYPTAKAWLANE